MWARKKQDRIFFLIHQLALIAFQKEGYTCSPTSELRGVDLEHTCYDSESKRAIVQCTSHTFPQSKHFLVKWSDACLRGVGEINENDCDDLFVLACDKDRQSIG